MRRREVGHADPADLSERQFRISDGRVTLDGDRVPTLVIVGGLDVQVIRMNEDATHLFEEPGTLNHVAELAREWFLRQLREPPA